MGVLYNTFQTPLVVGQIVPAYVIGLSRDPITLLGRVKRAFLLSLCQHWTWNQFGSISQTVPSILDCHRILGCLLELETWHTLSFESSPMILKISILHLHRLGRCSPRYRLCTCTELRTAAPIFEHSFVTQLYPCACPYLEQAIGIVSIDIVLA